MKPDQGSKTLFTLFAKPSTSAKIMTQKEPVRAS